MDPPEVDFEVSGGGLGGLILYTFRIIFDMLSNCFASRHRAFPVIHRQQHQSTALEHDGRNHLGSRLQAIEHVDCKDLRAPSGHRQPLQLLLEFVTQGLALERIMKLLATPNSKVRSPEPRRLTGSIYSRIGVPKGTELYL